jgi:hypothetical protein
MNMNAEQLDLAQQLKNEVEKNEPKQVGNNLPLELGGKAPVSKLAELQATASQVQKQAKDAEWGEIKSYNQDEIPPLMMAKLYAALPWGPSGSYLTIPQALMLAITARRRKLNPEEGDIFILPSGRIGTSLQGQLKEAVMTGNKLGARKFDNVTRPWPKGLVLTRKKDRQDIDFSLPEEPGVRCEMTINDSPVEYTAWLTEWFMGGNPNWYSRMDWMLRVRAMTRVLSLGTGIAVSEEIADTDSTSSAPKTMEPKAPKETPFVR